MAYKPRLTAPTTSDKHWISTSKGGYNRCIVIDSKAGRNPGVEAAYRIAGRLQKRRPGEAR